MQKGRAAPRQVYLTRRQYTNQSPPKVNYTFKPNYSVVAEFPGVYKISDLEKEVGVYSAASFLV